MWVPCAITKMNAHFFPRFFICLQAVNTHSVRLLARMLVPPQDFPVRASWGKVKIFPFWLLEAWWRSKRCKVEHNTNSVHKIFWVKEIAAVYIQTFSKLLVFCPSNDNTATDFYARIVDVCLFQVVINWTMPTSVSAEGILTLNHRNPMKRFSSFSR